MNLFDSPITLEALLHRIEVLEAAVLSKPSRQRTDVPEELRPAWNLWTLHKGADRRWTAIAKERQLTKLADFAGKDSALALRIVEEAIEKGWTTFYEPKEQPRGKVVSLHKSPKQAMTPSESPLERDLARVRQDYHFGVIDEAERDRRLAETTNRYRER